MVKKYLPSNLDRQFWKEDNVVHISKPKAAKPSKKKARRTAKNKQLVEARMKAIKILGLSEYSSWNAVADAIARKRGESHPCTRQKCKKYILDFVRNPDGVPTKRRPRKKPAKEFYASQAWKETRYIALRNSHGCCNLCGARASDGAILHVDHIVPRSVDPSKELDIDNLQVLCADCNVGKSNRDDINWRQHWESI